MQKCLIYEKDENGDKTLYVPKNKLWYAYSGKYMGDVCRGSGKTKELAVQNSIDNTEESNR